ncbi:hypothetical protein DAEQUDRAFT_452116 [Daedalea quercina L-15889]|uniref:Uncharacterized protein n=1 Tax=Daedalea quercina L-15889 TaxID=1314783 RepID=A0A165N4I4_9APHY|nr:hypothetical protein DAEQUDRAFT_452116 [Daedalea quercina L-15889]
MIREKPAVTFAAPRYCPWNTCILRLNVQFQLKPIYTRTVTSPNGASCRPKSREVPSGNCYTSSHYPFPPSTISHQDLSNHSATEWLSSDAWLWAWRTTILPPDPSAMRSSMSVMFAWDAWVLAFIFNGTVPISMTILRKEWGSGELPSSTFSLPMQRTTPSTLFAAPRTATSRTTTTPERTRYSSAGYASLRAPELRSEKGVRHCSRYRRSKHGILRFGRFTAAPTE